MSSPSADRPWSLTRRMALMFAVTTSAIVALYGAWSAYVVFSTTRNELRAFIDHELEELALNIGRTDGSAESLQRCVGDIAQVTEEPKCAFRVRDAGGTALAEAGAPWLLRRIPGPVDPADPWRRWLFDERVAVGAMALDGPGAGRTVEVVVDARSALAALQSYLRSAALIFLGSVVLAAVAGWWTARRGLRSLRDVVSQAGGMDSPATLTPVHLHGAPEEVREVGEAMNALLARIHHGLAEMRTFTASLAHELRSPLQNLIGETEVTLLSQRSTDTYEKLLRSNLEDLYDLTDAVDNLVAWCRSAEPERPPLSEEVFDLAVEAEMRLNRERRVAERAGVELLVDSEGDTGLTADREASLRVLRNLVGNAIAWSPAGTVVEVDITGDVDAVRVDVADRGPGVDPELGEKIFEPFVSARTREGRRGGYGLGLAICRGVMADHGGTLTFAAREGGGAVFTARFPRAAGTLTRTTSSTSRPSEKPVGKAEGAMWPS